MATKVVALLGNWLFGKRRLLATGAVGLPSMGSPLPSFNAFSLQFANCKSSSQNETPAQILQSSGL
jgi:hypothetical protein